jgi:RNA polymerase sigma-70 factor (ECF subfamily)
VAQITDPNSLEKSAKQADRSDPANLRDGLPNPALGDHDPREEILALRPRLERYARALTRDVVGAEDLVQDCLARGLEKIHMWQPGTDLRAWLFTILYRQYISHTRHGARHRADVELPESDARLALLPNQTARLELRDLERALARLPKEQRSVILLVGMEGMDYAEAAAVVRTPVGTVRSRVARGRESLRAMTGFFPARHSRSPGKAANLGSSPPPAPMGHPRLVPNGASSAPYSPEVVQ